MSKMSKFNKENKKDINENRNISAKDNLEMSIKEALRRKRISIVKPKEDQILDLVRDEIDGGLKVVENPKLLLYFLSNTPVFKQYIYIHNFSSEILMNSFRFGKYIKLEKDTILFKQGDKTDYFYLILSGCIGFILTTYDDNILKKNPYSREVNSIRVGSFFGEWGFIYKINRTVSAYAKEDTLLLGFDKFTFKMFFQENIILSENNSKKFVLRHIKTFRGLNETAFNSYYREVKKIYCIPGKEIFTEGNDANSFYLVYMGSCVVKKGLTNLIIKDPGDFIGIESLFKDKYETSIYPYTDGTVLFKFLLNSFTDNIIINLKIEFETYYKKQKEIIKSFSENYNKYKDKYKMNFINLIENIKKNKLNNHKQINNISIDKIRTNYNMIKKKHYSSPYKSSKYCNLVNINNYKLDTNRIDLSNKILMKYKNLFEEELPFKDFKSSNETPKNFVKMDAKKINTGIKLDNSKSRNNKMNLNMNDIYNKNNFKKIRPYSSLSSKNFYNNNFQKKNFQFFYEETKDNNSHLKRKKRDNHFSRQNFKINKKRKDLSNIKNKMVKNKSINNITEKKYFQPIYLSNNKNYFEFIKKKDNINSFRNNYSQSERKGKKYKNNETQKNFEQTNESNYEIPLIIIRNVSFYGPKIKKRNSKI